MSDPLAYFGLRAGADERSVKRAYAALLKRTRPDNDPEAFQALHAAYQAALQACRSPVRPRSRGQRTDEATRPEAELPVATSLPDPEQTGLAQVPVPVDIAGLAWDIVAKATRANPVELKLWLMQQPDLWSLASKPAVGRRLLEVLHAAAPSLAPASFEVLATFFDWNQVQRGVNARHISALRARLSLQWMLDQGDVACLTAELEANGFDDFHGAQVGLILEQLRRPFSWSQALMHAFKPGVPRDIRRVLLHLEHAYGEALPAKWVDPRQAAFWRSAGDPARLTRPSLAVQGCRGVFVWMLITGIFCLGRIGQGSTSWLQDIGLGLATGLAGVILVFGALAARDPFARQLHAEAAPSPGPWLRLLTLPLATCACMALTLLFPFRITEHIQHVLLVSLAILAFVRLLRRAPMVFRKPPWDFPWLVFNLLLLVAILSAAMNGNAWITVLVLWALDAAFNWGATRTWRHRATPGRR